MSQSITRRRFLESSVGVAGALSFACSSPAPAEPRPNIVLLMGDDHAWDEVAYNGHPHLKTPVLDEMAASGLRFDNFYSAHPTCSPTRGSVMTGRHPNRYGTFVPNCSIRPEEITIAQLLCDAGYVCGHFGKWHLGPVKAESPTNPGAMGFDEWLSHDNFFEMNPTLSRNGAPPEQLEGEGSEVIVEEAIHFIDKARQDQRPFFTVVWFGSPHEPYSGLDKDLALYDDIPEKYADRSVTLTSMETGGQVERPLGEVLRERYAEITAMDRAIGRLRQHLADQGLRDNTIFWYCGDNGIPVSGRATTPFRGMKADMYEGGIRVPGILEWPQRISQPGVTDVNAVTSDMLPTICDALGLPLPERPIDGVSLTALIDGRMAERPSPICFWSFGNDQPGSNREPYIDPKLQEGTTPLVKLMDGIATRNFENYHHREITERDFSGPRAILDNRYKLVIAGEGDEATTELFDLRSDRAESSNLVETEPEIAKRMQQQLRDWQQSVLESLTEADYG